MSSSVNSARRRVDQRRRRNRLSGFIIVFGLACILIIIGILHFGGRTRTPVQFTGTPPASEFGSEIAVLTGSEANVKRIIKESVTDDSEVTKVSVAGKVDTDEPGVYRLTIKAADDAGNKVVRSMDVIVTDPAGLSDDCIFITGKGFIARKTGGVTRIGDTVIANKTYSVPEKYGSGLTDEMKDAFDQMKSAAAAEGLSLSIVSGFRSYETQTDLFNRYSASDGIEAAERYSARPGHSEHQTGTAADLNDVSKTFAQTDEYKWLQEHAYEYGFVMRYPDGKEELTGYIYEPWHYRYTGTELAAQLYNDGDWITFEEYFGIDSRYSGSERTDS